MTTTQKNATYSATMTTAANTIFPLDLFQKIVIDLFPRFFNETGYARFIHIITHVWGGVTGWDAPVDYVSRLFTYSYITSENPTVMTEWKPSEEWVRAYNSLFLAQDGSELQQAFSQYEQLVKADLTEKFAVRISLSIIFLKHHIHGNIVLRWSGNEDALQEKYHQYITDKGDGNLRCFDFSLDMLQDDWPLRCALVQGDVNWMVQCMKRHFEGFITDLRNHQYPTNPAYYSYAPPPQTNQNKFDYCAYFLNILPRNEGGASWH